MQRVNKSWAFVIFLLVCEGLEIMCSYVGLAESLYRLLTIRYIFLFYLGWLWVKEGIKVNWLTIFLSVVSLAAVVYFEYFSVNDEPCFFTTGWKSHRWPCYFWVAYGLTAILYSVWQRLKDSHKIVAITKILTTCTYEIFLVQMTVRFFFLKSYMDFIPDARIAFALWIVIFWTVSIYGGILLNKLILKINAK